MPDVRKAILEAALAANRLHASHGVKKKVKSGVGRIDVFGLLAALDIPVMFQPMKGLLGCYLEENGSGVLLTTQRPLSVQRFTAAHELGHAVMGHSSSLDDESRLNRTPFESGAALDLIELQANAFASELLTPKWLITHHMGQQGWASSDLTSPKIVYQLALRMGSSYAATCHALLKHNAISKSVRDSLLKTQPKSIKQQLTKQHTPESWYADIWVLGMGDQRLLIEGSAHDIVILELIEHASSGYMWSFDSLSKVGLKIVEDIREARSTENAIGSIVERKIVAEPEQSALGHVNLREQRPWLSDDESLQSLEFDVNLTGPLQTGLLPAQRQAMLSRP